VLYRPNRPVRLPYHGGKVWALDERQVEGIVQPSDGLPFFRVVRKDEGEP
jgi:hypothetical protein